MLFVLRLLEGQIYYHLAVPRLRFVLWPRVIQQKLPGLVYLSSLSPSLMNCCNSLPSLRQLSARTCILCPQVTNKHSDLKSQHKVSRVTWVLPVFCWSTKSP